MGDAHLSALSLPKSSIACFGWPPWHWAPQGDTVGTNPTSPPWMLKQPCRPRSQGRGLLVCKTSPGSTGWGFLAGSRL